jgi:hypothetical protein
MNCILQLNAMNEVGKDSRHEKAQDFMKMIYVEKMIIRIQSNFRRILALKKIEREVESAKAKLARRANKNQNTSNEELALQEFKQRLSKKGLTPESFYRTCDENYRRTVSTEKFKNML